MLAKPKQVPSFLGRWPSRRTRAAGSAVRSAKDAIEAERLVKETIESTFGLRDFVEQSLNEILAGVDRAAAAADARALTEGLAASGLVNPSRIGSRSLERDTVSKVEFDVAVATEEQKITEDQRSKGMKAGLAIKVFNFGGGVSRETSQETRDAVSASNRIRFSVPVVFASPGESTK